MIQQSARYPNGQHFIGPFEQLNGGPHCQAEPCFDRAQLATACKHDGKSED
jgi:hypothetical protein